MSDLDLVIAGPTASGKSQLAMAIAAQVGGEIINCDSVQLYQGFDIGSAKAEPSDLQAVPHHMIDITTWRDPFDCSQYKEKAQEVLRNIVGNKIVVGGSGLYLKSLLGDGFHDLPQCPQLRKELEKEKPEQLYQELLSKDPQRAQQIHPNDYFRIRRAVELIRLLKQPISEYWKTHAAIKNPPKMIILLNPPKEVLQKRIVQRCQKMLGQGWIEEVRSLRKEGCPNSAYPMNSIGYLEICSYLDGELPRSQLLDRIVISTRQYAKRQRNWFKQLSGCREISSVTPMDELPRIIQDFLSFDSQ